MRLSHDKLNSDQNHTGNYANQCEDNFPLLKTESHFQRDHKKSPFFTVWRFAFRK